MGTVLLSVKQCATLPGLLVGMWRRRVSQHPTMSDGCHQSLWHRGTLASWHRGRPPVRALSFWRCWMKWRKRRQSTSHLPVRVATIVTCTSLTSLDVGIWDSSMLKSSPENGNKPKQSTFRYLKSYKIPRCPKAPKALKLLGPWSLPPEDCVRCQDWISDRFVSGQICKDVSLFVSLTWSFLFQYSSCLFFWSTWSFPNVSWVDLLPFLIPLPYQFSFRLTSVDVLTFRWCFQVFREALIQVCGFWQAQAWSFEPHSNFQDGYRVSNGDSVAASAMDQELVS